VAVISLVGVVIQAMAQGPSGPNLPATTTNTSNTTITQPTVTTTRAAESSTSSRGQELGPFKEGSKDLPRQLVGTWRGRITQIDRRPTAEESELILALRPLPGATIVGTADYPDFGCAYVLRVTKVGGDHVALTEKLTTGGCTPEDQLIVRLLDKNRLFVTYEIPEQSRRAEGTLRRTAG
jgi:hypothetical protein